MNTKIVQMDIARRFECVDGKNFQIYVPQSDSVEEPKYKKDGTPKTICQNKQRGKKSEVYTLEIEDMKKLIRYFSDNGMWLHYLLFVLTCNLARRIGDMLSLTWFNFFNPQTGSLRNDLFEIKEDKTGKLANPRINSACRSAIDVYLEKTGCNPSKNAYTVPVFMQLNGTYHGKVLSKSGFLKSLKKAAEQVGIEYNIGTHSLRKTFGETSRMLHPYDYDSIPLLQTIYNHADTKTTERYIGLTKQKVNAYYNDMGEFFTDYVVGEKEYQESANSPVVSLDINDLRDVIKSAYEAGRNNAAEIDAIIHIDAISEIMKMVEELQK